MDRDAPVLMGVECDIRLGMPHKLPYGSRSCAIVGLGLGSGHVHGVSGLRVPTGGWIRETVDCADWRRLNIKEIHWRIVCLGHDTPHWLADSPTLAILTGDERQQKQKSLIELFKGRKVHFPPGHPQHPARCLA